MMPTRAEKHGPQERQPIHREVDEGSRQLKVLPQESEPSQYACIEEHPLEGLAGRTKDDIRGFNFTIAGLTDERPSCDFKAVFAEAMPVP